jgi:hypothetical protein
MQKSNLCNFAQLNLNASTFNALSTKQQIVTLLDKVEQLVCNNATCNWEFYDWGTDGHEKVLHNLQILQRSIAKHIDAH